MKSLRLMMVPVAFSGSLSSLAFADEGSFAPGELDSLLAQADRHGIAAYRQIAVDDRDRREGEGWRDAGWQVDVDRLLRDGSLASPNDAAADGLHWRLSGAEVTRALNDAQHDDVQRFASLAVDDTGHVDIDDAATHVI
ncbi:MULTISPECIES: hypothetical protein [Modicisalibacter]|uniref:hypothetical protein n=1 Tax=Modicisalibacter TaxID=574347 RepID=UPI00100AE2D4|nr:MULTISPECIES: hypothetical protein [Halomonadaceae]MBZ9559359.1 hypothetical protein [Modicisalibacter sp. R2A 31.J]MBZ9576476.1 hypothetical protein [Modicisalibacter sp. MOD 31.J]